MRIALVLPLIIGLLASAALGQSTAFTYQGELKSGGTNASGLHDLRFKLFDSATAGAQIGTTVCLDNVQVTDGKFTSTIDFGQQFANVSPRYLEIEVRRDTGLGCANTTGYTTLTPRQALTPAPRAIASNTASSLTIPNGSSVLVNLTNDGKVGVGIAAPTSQFELAGVQDALRLNAYQPTITFQDTSSGNNRSIVQGVNGGVFTIGGQFLNGTNGGAFSYLTNAGDLALGSYTPQAKLDVSGNAIVRGDIRVGANAQFRAAAGEENLRIVRGTIAANGAIIAGSGFTCTHTALNRHSIVFNTPFSANPTVTITPDGAGRAGQGFSVAVAPTDFNVYQNDFGSSESPFHFIAIGPR